MTRIPPVVERRVWTAETSKVPPATWKPYLNGQNLKTIAPSSKREPATWTVLAHDAVAEFLSDMSKIAKHTFPKWRERLVADIEECCKDYDTRRALLEAHPLDDYYLAAVVALEAVQIPRLFTPGEGAQLLDLLADQTRLMGSRVDGTISKLIFLMIARIAVSAAEDKKPHDQANRVILERMGVDRYEATKHLMKSAFYRHNLGEPLARGVPQWWKKFAQKFELVPAVKDAIRRAARSASQLRPRSGVVTGQKRSPVRH